MPLVMARRGAAALLKDCGAKDGRRLEGVKFPSDTVKINLIFCSPPQWQRGAGKGHLLSGEEVLGQTSSLLPFSCGSFP